MILFLQIYDKRDDFDFEIVNFPFIDGDVPRPTSYISQLICFARAYRHVAYFNTRNKLLLKAIDIINFSKPFLNFINNTMI